jgi:histidinol-phosphate aminotransferase
MNLRDDLRDLKPYAPGQHWPGVLKLASNENPLGPSPVALEAVKNALPSVYIYPDGASRVLRQALADALGVTIEQVAVGNGSDEIFTFITGAHLKPGDVAIGSKNTFSEYEFAVRLFGGTMRKTALREGVYDLDAMAAAIDGRTKMVFLCNPNNPTGGAFTHQALEAFLKRVPPAVLVVLDEAYCHYADDPDYPRALELLPRWPNLIVTRTFSKIYGLAAMRIGYALAAPELITHLAVVKQPFNVSGPAQIAGVAALGDRAFVERSQTINRDGKAFWYEKLKERGLFYFPTQANFICVSVDRDAKAVFQAMAEAGVTIRALGSFDLPRWIRITIGTLEQNTLCLKALDHALDTVPRDQ